TRSHKFNDRDHSEHLDGASNEHIPKFFGKSGHVDTDPKKTKKDGGGKGNWGHVGDEVQDYSFRMNNPRRRSNSSSHAVSLSAFKTKFETIEPEPVFEEEIHGPLSVSYEEDHNALEKASTTSSDNNGSVDGDEGAIDDSKKV
ncbi:hypothetical protein K402DRAFT_398815, partial [Aulographum hederae CBS 113979]